MLPAIRGLQTGIVTKLEDDPEGEDRIKVRLPVIHKSEEGIWCVVSHLPTPEKNVVSISVPKLAMRLLSASLMRTRGIAVVLGMLNSSKMPAHTLAKDTNHLKGYVSREKMKWMFDDEKKVITLETPGGNKIVISDEDKGITLTDQNW